MGQVISKDEPGSATAITGHASFGIKRSEDNARPNTLAADDMLVDKSIDRDRAGSQKQSL